MSLQHYISCDGALIDTRFSQGRLPHTKLKWLTALQTRQALGRQSATSAPTNQAAIDQLLSLHE